MTKKGVVLEIKDNKAFIMTPSGEFLCLKINDIIPKIGEVFEGEIISDFNKNYSKRKKLFLFAASIIFALILSAGTFIYITPVSAITVNINPEIKLESNRWNRIVKITPLNEDGKKLLEKVKVKNKNLNTAIMEIVKECKKENIINDEYISSGKAVQIYIQGNYPNKSIINNLEKQLTNEGLKTKIIDSKDNEKSTEDKKININNKNSLEKPLEDEKKKPSKQPEDKQKEYIKEDNSKDHVNSKAPITDNPNTPSNLKDKNDNKKENTIQNKQYDKTSKQNNDSNKSNNDNNSNSKNDKKVPNANSSGNNTKSKNNNDKSQNKR